MLQLTAERKRTSAKSKNVKGTEKESLFGNRKLIFSDMHGLRFLSEVRGGNRTPIGVFFGFIYFITFILFLFFILLVIFYFLFNAIRKIEKILL